MADLSLLLLDRLTFSNATLPILFLWFVPSSGSPLWSSMVLPRHRLLSSAVFLSCPVIWVAAMVIDGSSSTSSSVIRHLSFLSRHLGRRYGHRWFFAIVFCHPPSFFLVPSSGVASMVIDGSLPSSSVIRHLSFLSRHLGSPLWSSMVPCHRLPSSAIFLSSSPPFSCLCPQHPSSLSSVFLFSGGSMFIICLHCLARMFKWSYSNIPKPDHFDHL